MIRVLVVEDEPPIMRANITMIESSNPEFKIVATAINGKTAIEELEKQKIDVVFTDIKMPVMDGLELANHIKINYPHVITVITSGYSDFEYARKGIEFKVYDYILKPASRAKLLELLNNIKDEIGKRNHEKKKDILFGEVDKVESDMQNSECSVILICAGALPIYGNDMLAPAVAFWNKISINKIASSIFKLSDDYMISRGHTMSERVVVVESVKNYDIEQIIRALFDSLSNDEITITLGYKSGIKMSEINKTIGEIRGDISRKLILTKSQILYNNAQPEGNIELKYSKMQVEHIGKCLKSGENDKVKADILEVFEAMKKSDATQEEIVSFFDIIINYCYFNSESAGKKISTIKKELYETINNFVDYKSAAEDVASVLINVTGANYEEVSKLPKIIDNIQEYLKDNYQKSITNAVLSKEFGFVPSYISRLFKQYNDGISPGEYLSSYRIEKAKEIMKEHPDLLVKEIADMVGFHDAYYFSKIFKKKTGMWPTKYYGNRKDVMSI